MSLLYFFETSLEYHGLTSKQLYQLWLKHAGAAFKLYEQGIMKYAFKVSPSKKLTSLFMSGAFQCMVLAIWKLR